MIVWVFSIIHNTDTSICDAGNTYCSLQRFLQSKSFVFTGVWNSAWTHLKCENPLLYFYSSDQAISHYVVHFWGWRKIIPSDLSGHVFCQKCVYGISLWVDICGTLAATYV